MKQFYLINSLNLIDDISVIKKHYEALLTMMMRRGSVYLMLTVDPSGWTSITGYSLSYLCRSQRTIDVLLEFS